MSFIHEYFITFLHIFIPSTKKQNLIIFKTFFFKKKAERIVFWTYGWNTICLSLYRYFHVEALMWTKGPGHIMIIQCMSTSNMPYCVCVNLFLGFFLTTLSCFNPINSWRCREFVPFWLGLKFWGTVVIIRTSHISRGSSSSHGKN